MGGITPPWGWVVSVPARFSRQLEALSRAAKDGADWRRLGGGLPEKVFIPIVVGKKVVSSSIFMVGMLFQVVSKTKH